MSLKLILLGARLYFCTLSYTADQLSVAGNPDSTNVVMHHVKCVNVVDTVDPGCALPTDGEGVYFVVQSVLEFVSVLIE